MPERLPEPHRRPLPDVAVSERGLRQLEVWLLGKLRNLTGIFFNRRNRGRWLYIDALNGHVVGFDPTDFPLENSSIYLKLAHDFSINMAGRWNVLSDGAYFIFNNDFQISTTLFEVNSFSTDPSFVSTAGGFRFILTSATSKEFAVFNQQPLTGTKPTFKVTDSNSSESSTFHLESGKTVVFRDASDNPILTLTG